MHGYAATRAILAAAERAGASGGAASPEGIRQALLALDLMTPLERLQFDSRGESRHYRRVITQVQAGKRLVVYPPDRATGKAIYPMPPWRSR
jgi:branched-chain amino acid transport system substrate-binding protein